MKTLGFEGDILRVEVMLIRILVVRRGKGKRVTDLDNLPLTKDLIRAKQWRDNALYNKKSNASAN